MSSKLPTWGFLRGQIAWHLNFYEGCEGLAGHGQQSTSCLSELHPDPFQNFGELITLRLLDKFFQNSLLE